MEVNNSFFIVNKEAMKNMVSTKRNEFPNARRIFQNKDVFDIAIKNFEKSNYKALLELVKAHFEKIYRFMSSKPLNEVNIKMTAEKIENLCKDILVLVKK